MQSSGNGRNSRSRGKQSEARKPLSVLQIALISFLVCACLFILYEIFKGDERRAIVESVEKERLDKQDAMINEARGQERLRQLIVRLASFKVHWTEYYANYGYAPDSVMDFGVSLPELLGDNWVSAYHYGADGSLEVVTSPEMGLGKISVILEPEVGPNAGYIKWHCKSTYSKISEAISDCLYVANASTGSSSKIFADINEVPVTIGRGGSIHLPSGTRKEGQKVTLPLAPHSSECNMLLADFLFYHKAQNSR